MADKELRRLKRRELLQMLLVQCEETERLQRESDEMREQLEMVMESYGRLKKKLDVKDERLNQKDAKIAELNSEIEELKAWKEAEFEEAGSITEATLRLSGVFEEAQRAAEQYLMNVRRLKERTQAKTQRNPQEALLPEGKEEGCLPFGTGAAGIWKKTAQARTGQIVRMPGQTGESPEQARNAQENRAGRYMAASGDNYG